MPTGGTSRFLVRDKSETPAPGASASTLDRFVIEADSIILTPRHEQGKHHIEFAPDMNIPICQMHSFRSFSEHTHRV